jgi:peroxiredoxin
MDWNSKTTWRWLMALLPVLGVAWIAVSRVPAQAVASGDDRPPMPLIGFTAPEFTLETLDGQMLTLSDLRGQAVLVNFWATWCPACRAEMPAIQQVYDQYRDQGFMVLAVNLREGDAQVSAFAGQQGLTFPILMDRDGQVFARYRVKALPSSFFVDRAGVIRQVTVGGPMVRAFVESEVTPLLAEEGGE